MKLSSVVTAFIVMLAIASAAHAAPVPELDPSSVGTAGLLVAGVAMVVRGRFKK